MGAGLEQQFHLSEVFEAAMRAGLVNVASQLAELAAGDIKMLDFKQILASMVGAGLGQKILPEFHHEFNWGYTEEDAAGAVMDGFIDSAIEGKSPNVENMFEAFAQSAAEDWLSTGRGAISQANAQGSKTKASPGKIPAPADTENTWKNRGRNAEKKSAANDARWRKVGAAATHQNTQATHYMLNQMQQAAAKSGDFLSPDDLFKIYAAQVGAYDDLNSASIENSNDSEWQNAARASTSISANTSRGFFATAAHDFSAFASGVSEAAQHVMWDVGHLQDLKSDVSSFLQSESAFSTELKDPLHYAAGSLEYVKEQDHDLGLTKKYTNYRNYANAGIERTNTEIRIAEQRGFRTSNFEKIQAGYAEDAAKYGARIDALKWARFASTKVMLPLEGVFGAYEVYHASPEDRVEVAFEETGSVVGGFFGGVIGGAAGATETAGTFGLGAPLGVGLTVGGNIAGAAAGRVGGRYLYGVFENVKTAALQSYDETENYFRKNL